MYIIKTFLKSIYPGRLKVKLKLPRLNDTSKKGKDLFLFVIELNAYSIIKNEENSSKPSIYAK